MNICELTYHIKLKPITFCKYQLVIGDKQMQLSFPQLLQLRNKIAYLTSSDNLIKIIDNENFTLLFIADKQHLVYLEIWQLLDLKDEVAIFFEDLKAVSF